MKAKNNGRRHSRCLTWIDWGILILTVAALTLCFAFLQRTRNAGMESIPITYQLRLSRQENAIADDCGGWDALIPIGSNVTNEKGTATLGFVSNLSVVPCVEPTVRDGAVVFIEVPTRSDVLITVRANALERVGEGLRVNDIRISAGGRGDFRIGGYFASGVDVTFVKREVSE